MIDNESFLLYIESLVNLSVLVFARRCAPGSGYSMGMLKEAIGNSIRCARHKIKIDQGRLFAVAAVQELE